jgi:hypothetical protein
MALSIFCPLCGHKNEYTIKKPEKCSSCNGTLQVIQSTQSVKKVIIPDPEDIIDAGETFKKPSIKKIELATPIPSWQSIRQPASTVMGTINSENIHTRPRDKKFNPKKVMEEFKREASNSHESISVGD